MITSRQLKRIKELSLNYTKHTFVFLCQVAEDLGIEKEFQEYLLNNLDDTMINEDNSTDSFLARWYYDDLESRLNWLDKHIKLLS